LLVATAFFEGKSFSSVEVYWWLASSSMSVLSFGLNRL
jgi:hypothetical protein